MNRKKDEILKYYNDLINSIDIKCEKSIIIFNSAEIENEINSKREKFIAKIKEILNINLKNLSLEQENLPFNQKFCFLLTNNSKKPKDTFDFKKVIGKLVITNEFLSKKIINKLINNETFGHFKTFQETAKFRVFRELLNQYDSLNDSIIDLTDLNKNQIDFLYIFDPENKLNHNDLDFISNSVEKIQEFLLRVEDVKKLPKLDSFRNLKKLSLELFDLEKIKQNDFISLESLVELEIKCQNVDSIEKNSFIQLKNLKKLSINESKIEHLESEIFNGLNELKILNLKQNKISILEENCFKLLNNLEVLILNEYSIEEIESSVFEDLPNLKTLELSTSGDEINLESCENLEILDLNQDKLKNIEVSAENQIRFLNIRNCNIEKLELLNKFNQLEYLDLSVVKNISNSFHKINLPSLKYLALRCKIVPIFGSNFSSLQGLELVDAKTLLRDSYIHLKNLEYLQLTRIDSTFLKKLEDMSFFVGIKKLKYFSVISKNLVKYEAKMKMVQEIKSHLFEISSEVFTQGIDELQ
ncbi:unnamed protein product [Brachionus calyciflorus]|uniref:Uncharacterized protein n=1 Tax=Brachionus calyciflorus TaxID=104777 RepID=A0A813WSF8_9BILA|nr:unnamed protein product [Brachionus calyciflorus]